MIDEEETVRRFGYRSTDWKPQSNKKIVAACDECGKIRILPKRKYRALCVSCSRKEKRNPHFGKHRTKETKQKIGEAHKGKKNHNFGKHLSEETKQKMSKAKKGKHPTEETKKKLREARKKRRFPKSRTKPELIFEEICKKNTLPFIYTGDGDFWIHNINPDFVECNGKKIAIEIFGDYWHSPLLRQNIPYNQTYEGRKKTLKKYGWKLAVFWESDLKREDAEQFVLSQLKEVI